MLHLGIIEPWRINGAEYKSQASLAGVGGRHKQALGTNARQTALAGPQLSLSPKGGEESSFGRRRKRDKKLSGERRKDLN